MIIKNKLIFSRGQLGTQGVTILCHGVFDILHIGHIEYFEKAKQLGEILIVSITTDIHVNKGPGRPHFRIDERVKQVAALAVVDAVIISERPTAEEVIRLIRPDIYCKGSEYKEVDLAGNLEKEIKAVQEVGGKTVFIDTDKKSSTELYIKEFLNPKIESQLGYLANRDILLVAYRKFLSGIKNLKIALFGELIIDRYTYVWIENVSSKSPSLSGRYVSESNYLGGAGVVAQILQLLGANVSLFTYWCEKTDHTILEKIRDSGVELINVFTQNVAIPTKNRFIHIDNNQRVFEIFNIGEKSKIVKKDDLAYANFDKNYDLILINDFGHGLMDDELIERLSRVPVQKWVNAQTNSENYGFNLITKYKGFGNFVLDKREASLAIGKKNLEAEQMFSELEDNLAAERLCITLGRDGAIYKGGDGRLTKFKALADHANDAMGAGDAFFLMYALTANLSDSFELAILMASLLAAEKVSITGHDAEATVRGFENSLKYQFGDTSGFPK